MGIRSCPIIGPLAVKLFDHMRLCLFTPTEAPEYVIIKGFTLYWPAHDSGQSVVDLLYDSYEPGTTRFFETFLKDGMTVVDVGAHIGYFTLLAARLVGSEGKVYAFEPHPTNFQLLVKNIEANRFKNVICIQKAVSNKCGKCKLYLASHSSGQHSIFSNVTQTKVYVEVETVTLDSFFASLGWPSVDLIKIDVEGAEKMVFEGMRELIHRNPNLKIVFELNLDCQKRGGINPIDLFVVLKREGFNSFYLLEEKPIAIKGSKGLSWVLRNIKAINILAERGLD
jgi:FkbM family methyltransferase